MLRYLPTDLNVMGTALFLIDIDATNWGASSLAEIASVANGAESKLLTLDVSRGLYCEVGATREESLSRIT